MVVIFSCGFSPCFWRGFFLLYISRMKKTLIITALAAVLFSCEKNECGCLEPLGKSKGEEVAGHLPGGIPYYRTVYYGKYANECGESKTVKLTKAEYDAWAFARPLCD